MRERPILFQGAMVRGLLREVDPKTQTRRAIKPQPLLSPHHEPVLPELRGGGRLVWMVHTDRPTYQFATGDVSCPYGQPGEQLWVRETYFAFGRWETRFSEEKGRDEWHFIDMTLECGKAYGYAADGAPHDFKKRNQRNSITPAWWKRPAIFMPRGACRIVLEITDVRVERLQAISEADAIAEGCITEEVVSGYDGSTIKVPAEIPHPSGVGAQGWDCACDWYADLWESINGEGSWNANPWVWAIEFKRMEPK